MECSSGEEREQFGGRLKAAIENFTLDFLPHMKEEEEVSGRERGREERGRSMRGREGKRTMWGGSGREKEVR